MSEQARVWTGAAVGALVGATAAYLFFTDRGRMWRDRLEPAVDDARREFARFRKTIEKIGDLANDSLRVVSGFNAARAESQFPTEHTSH